MIKFRLVLRRIFPEAAMMVLSKVILFKIVILLMPITSIVSMLPSINGLGIREGAIYFLFGPYVGYENALALGRAAASNLVGAGSREAAEPESIFEVQGVSLNTSWWAGF